MGRRREGYSRCHLKNLTYLHHSADFGVKRTHFVPTLHGVITTWRRVGWRGPLNKRQENTDEIRQISILVVVLKSAKNRYFKAEIRHTWYYWFCICWSLLKNHAFEKVLIFTTTILIGEYVRLAKKIYSLINVSANSLWTVSKYYLRSLAIAWSYWSLNL